MDAGRYKGALAYVFCDIKRALAGQDTPSLDALNVTAVLDALQSQLGCNGVRLYIDPTITDPTQYPTVYTTAFEHARHDLGLAIYANPLGTGSFGMTTVDYGSWIARYGNYFQPDFLGPFNESGLDTSDIETIAEIVSQGLSVHSVLVGPDIQHVESSQTVAATPSLPSLFGFFGSHNAVNDQGATTAAWTMLRATAGLGTWSTENPRPWSYIGDAGLEIGVKAVVDAPIAGLVLYEAFPVSLGLDGGLTPTGQELAAGLLR